MAKRKAPAPAANAFGLREGYTGAEYDEASDRIKRGLRIVPLELIALKLDAGVNWLVRKPGNARFCPSTREVRAWCDVLKKWEVCGQLPDGMDAAELNRLDGHEDVWFAGDPEAIEELRRLQDRLDATYQSIRLLLSQ